MPIRHLQICPDLLLYLFRVLKYCHNTRMAAIAQWIHLHLPSHALCLKPKAKDLGVYHSITIYLPIHLSTYTSIYLYIYLSLSLSFNRYSIDPGAGIGPVSN